MNYYSPLGDLTSDETKDCLMAMITNSWLLWLALAAIVLGFVALEASALSIGPLLLVSGYCVLLPAFLWRSFQKNVGE